MDDFLRSFKTHDLRRWRGQLRSVGDGLARDRATVRSSGGKSVGGSLLRLDLLAMRSIENDAAAVVVDLSVRCVAYFVAELKLHAVCAAWAIRSIDSELNYLRLRGKWLNIQRDVLIDRGSISRV